jgi:serine/threonine-protein phosphatase 6 catalytic subunit
MALDIDDWLARLRKGELPSEDQLKELTDRAKDILLEENNVVSVAAPVVVCGDIHGQFYDLLTLFATGGEPAQGTRYIFMGDFVDRGNHSLETLVYLLLLKVRYPDQIFLLRGNHESRQITQIYGFYDECARKYGSGKVWRYCTDLFDYIALAAVISNKVLCVHGGLSPDIKVIDQMRLIDRKMEIPHEGPFCDLVWSDPEDIEAWQQSPRGAGWLFGGKVTREFNHLNGLDLICRAHQLVQEGFKYMFPESSLVTVWSAPNYCYRCGNLASVLSFDENLNREFKIFKEVQEEHRKMMAAERPAYFL